MLLEEEERLIVPGVTVRAATFDALVDFLIDSFLPTGGLQEENNNFPRVMFLMHQWFISSESLAQCLTARYPFHSEKANQQQGFCAVPDEEQNSWFSNCESFAKCHPSCPHTQQKIAECAAYQYKARICYALRYWIRMFPIHFDLNGLLASIIQDFQRRLHAEGSRNLSELLDLSKLPSYDWARNMSVRNPTAKHTRKISLVFDHLEPSELADHITYLEHKVMRRISFTDFKLYAEYGTFQDNSKLERSIALFNGLSQWIQFMVLSRSLPQQRADVIVKIVEVAEKLLQQKNFDSLMSVVGGLSHSCLARLSKTMAFVPQETKKKLEDLTLLLSSSSNFSSYRKSLAESQGFKIPILGVHMKDLICLHIALSDTVEDDLINFRKITQLSLIFQELWELQNSVPSVMINADLVNTLRLSLDTAYSEDELYELSLLREPRISLSSQSSLVKLTVFSEWVCGKGDTPEDDVLDKYIQSIIDVIFRNYDNDKDGYLSADEFDSVSVNFPHIDSFSSVDTDKDGLVSKSEMKAYFLSGDGTVLKMGFQHDFNETTYFKPTFCGHCAGLLWGLIKQGVRCRDCGVNAHKHCKDLLVLECRRAMYPTSRSNSLVPADGLKIKALIQKPWKRQLKHCQSDSADPNLGSKISGDSFFCDGDNGIIVADDVAAIDASSQDGFSKSQSLQVLSDMPPPSPKPCICKKKNAKNSGSSSVANEISLSKDVSS